MYQVLLFKFRRHFCKGSIVLAFWLLAGFTNHSVINLWLTSFQFWQWEVTSPCVLTFYVYVKHLPNLSAVLGFITNGHTVNHHISNLREDR